MSQTVTPETFRKGELAMFLYHDKLRMGNVETVGKTFVRLVMDETDPNTQEVNTVYRSFNYNKIKMV